MQKLEGKTFNVVQDNIEKLKGLFPEAFTENKVDIDKLRLALGENVEKEKERYEFTWHGKTEAIQLAQKQTTGTLLPCKDKSVNWETTNNLYIEGDNLEVLRILQNSYRNKVKMIYIDPPYNTGKDFVYKDDFHDNIKSYKERLEENMKSNPETNGRFHTDWLNLMYPRLKLARSFLTDDGVIFISIDDEELDNLKKICNEIFGEENFVSQIAWKRKKEISNDSKNVAIQGEYILVYSKSDSALLKMEPLSSEYIDRTYKEPNESFPLGKWRPVPITVSKGLTGGGYTYSIETPSGKVHTRLWAYPEQSYRKLLEDGRVYFGIDNSGVPQRVIYSFESKGQPMSNYWDSTATNKQGKKRILDLFGENYFDTPKPVSLIERMLQIASDRGSIVLDFFSGSATTAEAVMKINAEDGGKRKFIMVQLPEICDVKSQAYKAGYVNICEIGEERIRRAGQKILEEHQNKEGIEQLDIGFKVFKLDETNLKAWDEESMDLEKDLLDLVEPVKQGRTQEDVVYEILLKYGIDLTVPIEETSINGKSVFSVGLDYLLICLELDLTLEHIEEMAKKQPARIVFYDESFKSDTVRTNAQQILKRHGVEDIRVI
ncbi:MULTISPECIES: site-specific DNA-methyltransferase [Bacillus]|uniref:DNA methylase N-4 n=1 Tax=Bacillus cereus TaxID=1396 RepID=A0A150B7T2_BACCE|nr:MULTISPECIES: site-specific DNA-methyltransferase [Bacillus]KXY04231.1 DNA methylase N-4 [Bacillus cereus]MCG3790664.1 site-specific DNA-methyltransferase [Bacillus sp. UTDS19-33BHI26]RSC63251.1 site-specific DNA-methyltransferase [Bacillus sp. (in: firmicutes)]HDX9538234.1 site-specific DNA-methyltransferase [Bacillus thuringiensis]